MLTAYHEQNFSENFGDKAMRLGRSYRRTRRESRGFRQRRPTADATQIFVRIQDVKVVSNMEEINNENNERAGNKKRWLCFWILKKHTKE